jgi:hypothetical protein
VSAAVAPGVPDDLPRPTITPPQVTRRLREHLATLATTPETGGR